MPLAPAGRVTGWRNGRGGGIITAVSTVDLAGFVGWHSAYWADSVDTAAFANGASVATVHDQIGTEDLTGTGGGVPTMVSSDSNLNNRRSLLFTNGGYGPTSAVLTARAQPFTIVTVGKYNNVARRNYMHDGKGSSNRMILNCGITPNVFGINSGATIEGGASDTNPHMFQALYNGASSSLKKDGTQINSGNAGTNSYIGITIGSAYSGGGSTVHFEGNIAFVGVYYGSVESDPGWAAWKAVAATYYGLTVV